MGPSTSVVRENAPNSGDRTAYSRARRANSSHMERQYLVQQNSRRAAAACGPPPRPPPPQRQRQQVHLHLQQQQQQQRQQQRQWQRQQWQPLDRLLVIVEGLSDMRAVQRAAPAADVFVLGSATHAAVGSVAAPEVVSQLRGAAASGRYAAVVVLTDPDVAGRQARVALDEALPGLLRHAFLPAPAATAAAATKRHEAGNIGVEHAQAAAIAAALAAARLSDPLRAAFGRQDLLDAGLAAPMNQAVRNPRAGTPPAAAAAPPAAAALPGSVRSTGRALACGRRLARRGRPPSARRRGAT